MSNPYNPTLVSIGAKIIKRREELGMTATELAIQADLHTSTLSLYETGWREMGVDKLIRIALALKVPLSYFQPDELDAFSDCPKDYYPLIEQLNSLPMEKKRMFLNMFPAQIASI